MRLLPLFILLPLLAACGDSNRSTNVAATPPASKSGGPAADVAATLSCPAQLTTDSKLPAGSRVLGNVSGTLLLLEAEVASGPPDAVGINWALSPEESDDPENGATALPDGGGLTAYTLGPSRLDFPGQLAQYLLACRYAASWEARRNGGSEALALIPLPYGSSARCEIISPPAEGDLPLRSASCQLQPDADEPPGARAFLEQLYSKYQATGTGPDTLGNEAPQLFSAKLLALIREDQELAKGEVGLLNGDPICACQDWQALTVQEIWVVATGEDEAAAKVTFTNAGKPITVRFSLVREAGQWRIDNLAEPGIPKISLARYLGDGLQEQRGK